MWPFKRKEEDWEATWEARVTALEQRFGKSAQEVWHATQPMKGNLPLLAQRRPAKRILGNQRARGRAGRFMRGTKLDSAQWI